MKELINFDGGRGIAADDFQVLQEGILMMAKYFRQRENYLVSGGVVRRATLGLANEFTIEAGTVCINGKFIDFPTQQVNIVTTIKCYLVEQEEGVRPFNLFNSNRPGWKKYSVAFTAGSTGEAPFVEVGRLGFLRRLDHFIDPINTIKIIDDSIQANNFDSSGLGINDWRYWAICNGENGTNDMSGELLGMFSNAEGKFLRASSGNDNLVLTDAQVGRGGTLRPANFAEDSPYVHYVNSEPFAGTSYKIVDSTTRQPVLINPARRNLLVVKKIV